MFWLVVACILILLVSATSSWAGDFIISYWCGPPADTDPVAKYAEVAECNFNYVMPPVTNVTVEQNKAILDACAKNGLKYIVGDSRIGAKGPGDPGFEKDLDAVIADYANRPAMGGYYVRDEPNSADFPKLAAINQYLFNHDWKHLPFINLFPNYASEAQLGNKTYEDHVAQFCKTVKPRILGYDHYIMMACDPMEPSNLASYFQNMEVVRTYGLEHKIPSCFTLLSIPHFSYRNPTEADLRWQVNTALAYGYKAIIYFTYWSPAAWGFHHAIIEADGTRTERFDQVKRINGELKVIGPTLMKLTSTGVYHFGPVPEGSKALDESVPIQMTSDYPVVLGMFRHEDGSTWAMVVNRDLRRENSVVLKLAPSITGVQEMSPKTGVMADLKPVGHSITLKLRAGDRALLKL